MSYLRYRIPDTEGFFDPDEVAASSKFESSDSGIGVETEDAMGKGS